MIIRKSILVSIFLPCLFFCLITTSIHGQVAKAILDFRPEFGLTTIRDVNGSVEQRDLLYGGKVGFLTKVKHSYLGFHLGSIASRTNGISDGESFVAVPRFRYYLITRNMLDGKRSTKTQRFGNRMEAYLEVNTSIPLSRISTFVPEIVGYGDHVLSIFQGFNLPLGKTKCAINIEFGAQYSWLSERWYFLRSWNFSYTFR